MTNNFNSILNLRSLFTSGLIVVADVAVVVEVIADVAVVYVVISDVVVDEAVAVVVLLVSKDESIYL